MAFLRNIITDSPSLLNAQTKDTVPSNHTYLPHINELMEKVTKRIPRDNDLMTSCCQPDYNAVDQNCPSISEVVQPFILRSNTTAKLIIQSDFYVQKFVITYCKIYNTGRAGDGSQCLGEVISPQSSPHEATCHTIKGEIKLYVYDTQNKILLRENMSVDVCCSCLVREKDDFTNFLDRLDSD